MLHAREDYQPIQDPRGIIPDDEPVFLVRGQDLAAPETLRCWATLAEDAGAAPDIIQLVLGHAEAMEQWQQTQAAKVPDLPA